MRPSSRCGLHKSTRNVIEVDMYSSTCARTGGLHKLVYTIEVDTRTIIFYSGYTSPPIDRPRDDPVPLLVEIPPLAEISETVHGRTI